MRIFITGLSILFFIFSGVITYRALEIPDYDFSFKTKPEKPVPQIAEPEVQTAPGQSMQGEGADQVRVEELKEKITKLQEQLADTNKNNASQADARQPEQTEQLLAVLGGGTFQSGQVIVSSSLMDSVHDLVQKISASPGTHVVIEGHTDNIPIKAISGKQYQDNMDLSFLRAKAIARILVENGISRDRISVVGYGETRPVDSNDTDEGRAKNRRVEVKLIPGDREL